MPKRTPHEQLYSVTETDLSRANLKTILGSIPQPYCLTGGWSVFLIVNEGFHKTKGHPYQYSKDIDLGFHFDPNWNSKDYDSSPFGKAVAKIHEMGFKLQGPHFIKRYSAKDGHELTPEEERRLPSIEISPLVIDLLVDSADRKRIKMAKFPVIEELLLTKVFTGEEYQTRKFEGLDVRTPIPSLQMEMKIKSFPERTADDKKTKDLTDLIALRLYSGGQPPSMGEDGDSATLSHYKQKLKEVTDKEWDTVSRQLDMTTKEARRIANTFH